RWVATVASHAWEHRDGAFYVENQPNVTISLQQSTPRLREMVPDAFTDPLAFTIDKAGDRLPAFFKALDVWHQPIPDEVARCWLTKLGLQLPAGARLVRVRDALIDTRLLGFGLMRTALDLGVRLIPQYVERLERHNDNIQGLWLCGGEYIKVEPGDQVVL